MKMDVVYVPREAPVFYVSFESSVSLSVHEVLVRSGIFDLHPETRKCAVGIFSQRVTQDHLVSDGDRVELYRPLLCDPKEKRRQHARSMRAK